MDVVRATVQRLLTTEKRWQNLNIQFEARAIYSSDVAWQKFQAPPITHRHHLPTRRTRQLIRQPQRQNRQKSEKEGERLNGPRILEAQWVRCPAM